jgi:HEAT repeat protein
MGTPGWFANLDRVHSSYAVLLTLAALGTAAVGLYYVGALGWALRQLGRGVRGTVWLGFVAWEKLLAWAPWPVFLAICLILLMIGWAATDTVPGLTLVCAAVPLFMGVTACLAYMFIDVERYQVERGYKALHNPVKGQDLAVHLMRYGRQVRVPLLIAATVGTIGGFALLNQGLYETVGKEWFRIGEDSQGLPSFVDFLAYPLIHLLRIVDVLDLAESRHFLHTAFVRPARWPASSLLVAFKSFFTLVLLQQIFASVRQGRLLAETIADFWSPHPPIHERARSALPQFGATVIGPLLASLRTVETLTREQRDQLPVVLTAIGPASIPVLVEHLADPHEHVRAVAVGALGRLHAADALAALAPLTADASDLVRQTAVEAVGLIAAAGAQPTRRRRRLGACLRKPAQRPNWLARWRRSPAPAPAPDPLALAISTLHVCLADRSAAVRTKAARALGQIGKPAATAVPALTALLTDTDETLRCQTAESLGQVGCLGEETIGALIGLLQDPSPPIKASAARALGTLKEAAASAVPALVGLLQDRDEAVRTAAAAAVGQIGQLSDDAASTLLQGLDSPDNVVRAQTAEALGTIGAPAEETAPALVEALADSNDVVRAKAVEALGKIGEAAAEVAVPSLMRALRDQDNWVSALAAEALGQMGEAADEAVPALVRSLGHLNPQVRANAATALGQMGVLAAPARSALEKACQDEDSAVRAEALLALGGLGPAPAEEVFVTGLRDADPLVRTAAIEALSRRGDAGDTARADLLGLLRDANDQVKVQAAQVLPGLVGATPPVIEALCRLLLGDDSAWVQMHAARALGQLGPHARAAGPNLLRAVQTSAEEVRDQAMRAIARIQPPETAQAFLVGLRDASADIRKVASGGWMNAPAISEEVVPALVETLRDPETQVRANAAHALSRLESVPAEAVPLLAACAADPSDGLRLNAAMALRRAPPGSTSAPLALLLEDANVRVRLVAAGAVLTADRTDPRAAAILVEALSDPSPRVRKAALEFIDTLGCDGTAFLAALQQRQGIEEDSELSPVLAELTGRLAAVSNATAPVGAG